MKKRIVSLFLALALVSGLVPAITLTASANSFTPVTGWEMMEKLGVGINIGNTFDARDGQNWASPSNTPANSAASIWGQPWATKAHFDAMVAKGFSNVRIPITWEPHIAGGAPYSSGSISETWMASVKQTVDWALEAGLIVTINTHHERSNNINASNAQNSPQSLYDLIDTNQMTEAKAWLANVWGQIAEEFKDYPETLIFEPMNEPYRVRNDGWIWGPGGLDTALCERVNDLNDFALDLIRKSGGNNNQRIVMLTVPGAQTDAIPHYRHPDDPYTMLGIFLYPGHSRQNIKPALDKGIPIAVKETAPLNTSGGAFSGDAMAWVNTTFSALADMGVPAMWWDHTNNFGWGLFNRTNGTWNEPMLEAYFAAYDKTPDNNNKDACSEAHDFGANKNNGTHECKRTDCTVTETCSPNTPGTTCTTCGYVTPSGSSGGGSGGGGFGGGGGGGGSTPTPSPAPAPEPQPEPQPAPTHVYTVEDALNILRYEAGLITLTRQQRQIYDLNEDGKIDPLDAIFILRIIAGLIE